MEPKEIISLLFSVGQHLENDEIPSEDLVNSLKPYDRINRLYDGIRSYLSEYDDSELVILLKGFTFVESRLVWSGGSHASAIGVFNELLGRGTPIEIIDEVAAWVRKNTRNVYNPFGSSTIGGRTYSEFKQNLILRNKQVEERDKFNKDKAERRKTILKEKRAYGKQDRKENIRTELIEKLNNMPIREQLLSIAADDNYTPNFYPTKCADSATLEIILSLPLDVREILATNLIGRQRGPWASFKKKLMSTLMV